MTKGRPHVALAQQEVTQRVNRKQTQVMRESLPSWVPAWEKDLRPKENSPRAFSAVLMELPFQSCFLPSQKLPLQSLGDSQFANRAGTEQ